MTASCNFVLKAVKSLNPGCLLTKDLGLTIEGLGAYSEGIEGLLKRDLGLTIKGLGAYSEGFEGLLFKVLVLTQKGL